MLSPVELQHLVWSSNISQKEESVADEPSGGVEVKA